VTRSATAARIGSTLLADLGEANTGDPALLEDFLSFGRRRFPARATMLVLSNHGSGFYVSPEMLSGRGRRHRRAAKRQRRGFFRTTRERLFGARPPRGIAYDDGSGDCVEVLCRSHHESDPVRSPRRPA
jgi:Clostripain family